MMSVGDLRESGGWRQTWAESYRGQSIDLGSVSGVVYYTVEKSGYRIVATLADADCKAVRFEAVLAPGQTIVLSSPSARGEAPVRIEIIGAVTNTIVDEAELRT
jgi:hypothetical protein